MNNRDSLFPIIDKLLIIETASVLNDLRWRCDIAPCSLVTRCRRSGSAYELAAGRPASEPMLMNLISRDHSAFR